MTLGVIQNALLGLQTNQRRFESAADDIVSTTTTDGPAPDGPDLTAAAAELLAARRGFEASLAVARAGEEMLGSVIDVLA